MAGLSIKIRPTRLYGVRKPMFAGFRCGWRTKHREYPISAIVWRSRIAWKSGMQRGICSIDDPDSK